MLYQWPVYFFLGVAVSSPMCFGMFMPLGWKRDICLVLTMLIFLVAEVLLVMSGHHRGVHSFFESGYFAISGVPLEIELFAAGMIVPLIGAIATLISQRIRA